MQEAEAREAGGRAGGETGRARAALGERFDGGGGSNGDGGIPHGAQPRPAQEGVGAGRADGGTLQCTLYLGRPTRSAVGGPGGPLDAKGAWGRMDFSDREAGADDGRGLERGSEGWGVLSQLSASRRSAGRAA